MLTGPRTFDSRGKQGFAWIAALALRRIDEGTVAVAAAAAAQAAAAAAMNTDATSIRVERERAGGSSSARNHTRSEPPLHPPAVGVAVVVGHWYGSEMTDGLIREEWSVGSRNRLVMSREAFCDSLFHLADLFVGVYAPRSLPCDAGGYAAWLLNLLEACTQEPTGMGGGGGGAAATAGQGGQGDDSAPLAPASDHPMAQGKLSRAAEARRTSRLGVAVFRRPPPRASDEGRDRPPLSPTPAEVAVPYHHPLGTSGYAKPASLWLASFADQVDAVAEAQQLADALRV